MAANLAGRVPAAEFVMRVRAVAGFGVLAPWTAVAMAVAGLAPGDRFGSFQGSYHQGFVLRVCGGQLTPADAVVQPAGKLRAGGARKVTVSVVGALGSVLRREDMADSSVAVDAVVVARRSHGASLSNDNRRAAATPILGLAAKVWYISLPAWPDTTRSAPMSPATTAPLGAGRRPTG